MTAGSMSDPTTGAESERTLSRGEVAGRLLASLETVQRWIDDGRLRTVPGKRGSVRIPERSLLEFQNQAYRRENFNGVDHGLHSWPVQSAQQAESEAPRWPFGAAIALPARPRDLTPAPLLPERGA